MSCLLVSAGRFKQTVLLFWAPVCTGKTKTMFPKSNRSPEEYRMQTCSPLLPTPLCPWMLGGRGYRAAVLSRGSCAGPASPGLLTSAG